MTTLEAIKYVSETGKDAVSDDGEYELDLFSFPAEVRCACRGQQGGWVLSSIPLDAKWRVK